jgi:nickel transport protein
VHGWTNGLGARLLCGLVLLMLASPSVAHRLQVFATADGAAIEGRAYFVGGHPARDIAIQVLDGEGKRVTELRSDAEGRFRVEVSAAREYRIVAHSGDGHRAEWPISAAELAGAFDEQAASGADGTGSDSRAESVRAVGPSAQALVCIEGAELDRALSAAIERSVEQAVARQLRPLREALAEAQAQVALRDLLGGLGYIAGLAGLGLWWTRRRKTSGAGDTDAR